MKGTSRQNSLKMQSSQKSQSKSKSKSKDKSKVQPKPQPKAKSQSKSKPKKAVKEEEKKQQAPHVDVRPIIRSPGEFIAVQNRQNHRVFDVVRLAQAFRQGDQALQVLRFEVNQQDPNNQKSRSLEYQRDFVGFPNAYPINEDEMVFDFQVIIKKKKNINLDDPVRIKKTLIKKANKELKKFIKDNKQKHSQEQQKQKESILKAKEEEKKQNLIKKEEEKLSQKSQRKPSPNRAERANKRIKRQESEEEKGDGEEEDKEEQINTKSKKKRDVKARAKAIKKKEPEPVREDVDIPDLVDAKSSPDEELTLNCCQTCSNRNCLRAVLIKSPALFEQAIQSRAYVTSLLEHLSPEMRSSALEAAIAENQLAIIEMLFSQTKPENEGRMKKRDAQIAKFDTGEVGKMAFGFKIRKVNIMRGNRQGNNAFLEDSKHDFNTPLEYLLGSDFCMSKIFAQDSVQKETMEVLRQAIGDNKFDEFIERALPTILQHGCYQALLGLFEIKGLEQDPSLSLFSKVFYELLTCARVGDFTLTKQDLVQATLNVNHKPAHIAALNPSGAGLLFIKSQGEPIDVKFQKKGTSHYSAVCNTSKNLEFLISEKVELHEEDDHKKTPLLWAIEARKSSLNIKTIIEDLEFQFQRDSKDDHKKAAIHYVGQFGCENTQDIMDLMMENKAKMSLAGGWDKYTPLGYAAAYGQYEVVDYFLENVPRININKGDKYQRSPLIMACRNGHARIAALLIKHNADLNAADSSGNTALHHAAAYGWLECVALLIKYGAELSPENAWKTTPIVIALQKNHLAVVKELLSVKDDINANSKDDEGRTLLSLSMANINNETADFVNLLLNKKQADPNLQDAKGHTPLYQLVLNMTQKKRGLFQDHDDLEFMIVKILLNAGANVNVKAKDGKSAFSLAFEHGMGELLRLFGGSVDLNEDPTLFFAISGVNLLKVKTHDLLVECINQKRLEDETINYVNDQGMTPLLYYLHEFCLIQRPILVTIENMNQRREKVITNGSIIEEHLKGRSNIVQVSKEAEKMFHKEITGPFIEFIKTLIQNGANPNAYVLKLKQFREEAPASTQQATMSQISSQAQAAHLARRPPEKEQYVSEVLGLSNATHILINHPNKDLFNYFIAIEGLELNQVSFQKMTPFFMLVKSKDIKQDEYSKYCFEKLLQSGQVDINAPDQFGSSAFWYFYTQKRYDEAFYLVDQGANINHMDNYGEFALKREMYANDQVLIKKLLEKGADPNQKDEFGRTCLHLACNMAHRKDMKEVIKMLVKYNADVAALDFKQRTPLHYLFVRKNRRFEQDKFDPIQTVLQLLVNEQTREAIDINQQDVNGKSILHYAAQRASVDSLNYIVKVFGQESILFDQVDRWLNTPLSVAINCRHLDFIRTLLDMEVVNLKGFIYEEPKPKGNNQVQNQFGNQQPDNQELSDFEYLEVQQQTKEHDKDEALNLFRYALKNKLEDLEKMFIKHNYDKIQMVIDYICEGQINKLFEVIEVHFKAQAGAKESILVQKNDKQQNLIHVLARNSHRINEISESVKFYKQLQQEGVDPYEKDGKGRSTLQLAVISGNIHFVKFLIEVEHFDIQTQDARGSNLITSLLKGDRILKASPKLLDYLLSCKCNPDCLYSDKGKEGKITSVIHAITHEAKERSNIQEVLKILLRHANLSILDSTGRDAFMYLAMRNHSNTFNFILDILKDDPHKIQKDNVDLLYGKSFVHYIINPLDFGSYENRSLLKKALEFGFNARIPDKSGKTPYDYACLQKSGQFKRILEEFGIAQKQDEEMKLEDIVNNKPQLEQGEKVDFEKDAHDYLYSIQMQIDPQNSVPCDKTGKFNEDCEVMYDAEETEQHFDVYLTRVEIGKFQPGGDYLFYRMQLVWDRARELSILLTRWGRIGEEGAFQKTPFNKREEAISEFKKVFEQKTGNKWCAKDKFAKKFKKFQQMRTNYVTIDQKNYLTPFTNLEQAPLLRQSSKEVIEVMREICDVNTYLKALQNSGVDAQAMPFSNLYRQNLYDAREVLQKLEKTIEKLESLNPKPYSENERNKLLSLREKMWYLSSRFYEIIPHEEFRNKMVPPISTTALLSQKIQMLQNLIEIEMASKILLGAHGKKEEIHPLEYCLMAAGVEMQALERNDSEYKLIEDYVNNTNTENKGRQVQRILRIRKEADDLKFKGNMDNRVLLFHGSRISNFLSILSQGLRVQPLQAKRQGNLLGKGIYFSDTFSKAYAYTADQNAPHHFSRFVMVCEVALGEPKQMMRQQNNYELEEGFNSIMGVGRQGPEKKKYITLPDGAKVPYGKFQNYQNIGATDFQNNEYVITDPDQSRFRYLVQMK